MNIKEQWEEINKLIKNRKYVEAIQQCNNLIENTVEEKRGIIYFQRGNIELLNGDINDAINSYDKAVNSGYKEKEIYYERGNAKQRNNDIEGAKKDYKEALTIDGEYIEVYYQRGVMTGSVEDYNEVIKRNKKFIKEAYYQRAKLKEWADPKGALNDIQEVLNRDANFEEAKYLQKKLENK